jgi:hypothetical protein
MALSPNYGWAEPDNSSLVKNGAQDIRALGDAIDTSVWNVGYGQAGKNKIINGDFRINQRAFTSTSASGAFGFDRFPWTGAGSGTQSYSAQTFTAGAAPVAGYEAANFARITTSSQNATDSRVDFDTTVEDIRTFAGQTTTLSFWAKAATGTPKVAVELTQIYGTGGSPSAFATNYIGQVTLSTSWARYSITINVPSLSGKTVGTTTPGHLGLNLWVSAGSTYNARTGSLGAQDNTFDFWGMQWEYGSKATPFQTATGTIQGELSAAQRYYFRTTATESGTMFGTAVGVSASQADISIAFPTTMRTKPASVDYSSLSISDLSGGGAATTTLVLFKGTNQIAYLYNTGLSGLTQNRFYYVTGSTSSSYIGFSAEL